MYVQKISLYRYFVDVFCGVKRKINFSDYVAFHWLIGFLKRRFCAMSVQKGFMIFLLKVLKNSVCLLLLIFFPSVQDCVLNFYSYRDWKMRQEICTIIYIRRIPTNNNRSEIRFLIPLRNCSWTD